MKTAHALMAWAVLFFENYQLQHPGSQQACAVFIS